MCLATGYGSRFSVCNAKHIKSMGTTSINLGQRPASANQIALNAIILKLNAAIGRCTGSALTLRTAAGGVALMGGMVLATGADTIPQALLTLAAFAVAGTCLREEEEKGGEV